MHRRIFGSTVALAVVVASTPAQEHEGKTAREWLARLEYRTPHYRERGLRALVQMARQHASVREFLIEGLRDPSWRTRKGCAEVLGSIRPVLMPAVPALIVALRDPHDAVVCEVVAALAKLGPAAAPAVPALIEALRDPRDAVVSEVMAALPKLGPAAARALPALEAKLADPEWTIRAKAAWSVGRVLGAIGTDAAGHVPALRRLLHDPIARVRGAALGALRLLGPLARIAPELRALLRAGDAEEREAVARVLARIGPAARAAVPELRMALRNEGEMPRRATFLRALGAIGPGAKDAVPDLGELLADEDLARPAVEALRRIGPAAEDALPELVDALRAPVRDPVHLRLLALSREPRASAILRALAAIGPDAKVLPAIRGFLVSGDPLVRISPSGEPRSRLWGVSDRPPRPRCRR